MNKTIFLIATSILSVSCAGLQSHDIHTQKLNSNQNQIEQQSKEMNRKRIEGELFSIKAQISSLDDQISSVKARIDHYSALQTSEKDTMVIGAQSEILSYESQKMALVSRKERLEAELNSL